MCHRVAEGSTLYLADDRLILLGQDEEGGLSVIMVPDGYLSRHDIRQGIDEQRRTGEIVLWVLDGFQIVCVGMNRRRVVEQNDGPLLVLRESFLALGCNQQFRGDESQSAQHIHLVELGIVADGLLVDMGQHVFARILTGDRLAVEGYACWGNHDVMALLGLSFA